MKEKQERDEVKVCGVNAVLALAKSRIGDIIRIYLVEERITDLSPLLKWCAEQRRAYHVVPSAELEKIAGTVHHEGVCVLALQKRSIRFTELLADVEDMPPPVSLVFLEDVQNPHNLGAILRVAAHFGARALLVPSEESAPALSTALYRTAEGGVEPIEVVRTDTPPRALNALKQAGFIIFGTSSHAKTPLFTRRLPPKALFAFGSEAKGLSRSILAVCDDIIAVPGTGDVESLNVSCAAAVTLAEFWRTHRLPTPRNAVARTGSPRRRSQRQKTAGRPRRRP